MDFFFLNPRQVIRQPCFLARSQNGFQWNFQEILIIANPNPNPKSLNLIIKTFVLVQQGFSFISDQCYPSRAMKKQAWAFPSAHSWTALLPSWPNCRNLSSHTSWGLCALRTTLPHSCQDAGWIHLRRRGKKKKEQLSKRKKRTWQITTLPRVRTPAVCFVSLFFLHCVTFQTPHVTNRRLEMLSWEHLC